MIAQPVYPVAHQMFYQPAQAVQAAEPAKPAKPEEPKLKGDPNQEYYCRELDGHYSLRTANAIYKECQPGYWQSSQSGYPVWHRSKA